MDTFTVNRGGGGKVRAPVVEALLAEIAALDAATVQEKMLPPGCYTAPEFFREPSVEGRRPFAVLSVMDDQVTGVMTGVHEGDRLVSGFGTRPQTSLEKPRGIPDRTVALRSPSSFRRRHRHADLGLLG